MRTGKRYRIAVISLCPIRQFAVQIDLLVDAAR